VLPDPDLDPASKVDPFDIIADGSDSEISESERGNASPENGNQLFLSPSSGPPLCVDAQKVELQGSQLGESQVTRFKEIHLHDHPASAVPNA
jgi:hypothetical protein